MTGLGAMPIPGTREAPKTFTGDAGDFEDFMERFDILADSCGLSDADRIKAIVKYCDRKTKRLFQAMDGFDTGDWATFLASLQRMYPDTDEDQHYRRITLEMIAKKQQEKPIDDEEQLMGYYQSFLPVSKILVKRKIITEHDSESLFWFGFTEALRARLEVKLQAKLPTHDRSKPWPMAHVLEVARQVFNPNNFDYESPFHFLDMTQRMKKTDHVPQSDEPRRLVPLDKDDGYEYVRVPKGASLQNLRDQHQPSPSYQPQIQQEVVKRTVSLPQPTQSDRYSLEELVSRLATLDVNDTSYAVHYALLANHFPSVAKDFPNPRISGFYVSQEGRMATVPTRQFQYQAWNYLADQNASNYRVSAYAHNSRTCYFCGKGVPKDCAGFRDCNVARTYLDEKKVIWNGTSFRYPDGSPIPREDDATIQKRVDDKLKESAKSSNSFTGFFSVETQSIEAAPAFLLEVEDTIDYSQVTPPVEEAMNSLRRVCHDQGVSISEDALVAAVTRSQHVHFANNNQAGRGNGANEPRKDNPATTSNQTAPTPAPYGGPNPPGILKPPNRGPRDPGPQYSFRAGIEDERLIQSVFKKFLDSRTVLDNRELLAISPEIRKRTVELVKMQKIVTNSGGSAPAAVDVQRGQASAYAFLPPPSYSMPTREIDVVLPNNVRVRAVVDSGASIVSIKKSIAERTGHPINWRIGMNMTAADNTKSTLTGCAECLPIFIGAIESAAHAHIIEDPPYSLLLGLNWMSYTKAVLQPRGNDDWVLVITNPRKPDHIIEVPTYPHQDRHGHAPLVGYFGVVSRPLSHELSMRAGILADHVIWNSHGFLHPNSAKLLAYKPVDKKIRPKSAPMPQDCQIVRKFPHDPLRNLKPLLLDPPPFVPMGNMTQEKFDLFGIMKNSHLLPQERKIAAQVVMNNYDVFAWEASETTMFSREYFGDVRMPLKEHTPFFKRPIPWPPGLAPKLEQAIAQNIKAGIYEPCNSSYSSPIFWVLKSDGASLRLVHDLQTLNGHTIRDATLPPALEQYAEWYGGSFMYTGIDILNGFYGRVIAEESRDATAFDTPSHGKLRLTRLPQGWTNSMQVFQGDISFILQDERDIVRNYADDAPVKSRDVDPAEWTVPGKVRRVVFTHLQDVNRILCRFKDANICVSGKKFKIGVPELVVVGHQCSLEGRRPDPKKVDKILNWPVPKDVTGVRGFLGTAGDVRISIHKFAEIARPLVDLTRKDVEFVWTEKQQKAMDDLKERLSSPPCIRAIDYGPDGGEVILAVDSSYVAVGWILSQIHEAFGRVPSRYGSITWNEVQSRYSQAKIELFGLYRALFAMRLYLIGLNSFTVEMDAKYVKGMINKPDLQPTALLNRWIAVIHMFNFALRHIPARDFKGPDGLSRRDGNEGDLVEGEDYDEWTNKALGLGVWVDSWACSEDVSSPVSVCADQCVSDNYEATVYAYHPSDVRSGAPSTLIPRTPESIVEDERIDQIQGYLTKLTRPADLQHHEFKKLVNRSREFFTTPDGILWKRSRTGRHQKVISYPTRLELLIQAHDRLGHKSKWSVRRLLLDRVWWPSLESDVDWYDRTCHECQLRSVEKINILPSITYPAPLFTKVHIDTMIMPLSSGKRYLIQARCSLSAYVECRALRVETGRTVGAFIFEDLLTRWGCIQEIVTDNGKPIVAAVEELSQKYSLHHIKISPYNSRANGVVERAHRSLRDALVKSCEGDMGKWSSILPYVAWADRVTIRKATGMSPLQMAHGVEPVLPMDALHATYLAPRFEQPLSTNELISIRAKQLMRREKDLALIHDRIVKSRYTSILQFKHEYANRIREQDFKPGTLVLVRNVKAEYNLGGKHLPRYFGPMVVISQYGNGAYRLGELDGSIARTRYAGYRLLPYYARDPVNIPITMVYDQQSLQQDLSNEDAADDSSDEDSPRQRSSHIAAQQQED